MLHRQLNPAAVRALLQGLAAAILGLALVWVPAPAANIDFGQLAAYAGRHYGTKTVRAVEAWRAMLAQAADLDEQEKLRRVNDFWNRTIMGGEDISIWGQVDYWATPLESLSKGAGDCEDFVIAKYFSLLHIGVAPEKLRFVYVRAQVGGQSIAHMVLGYYPTPAAEPLVLDNLVDSIGLARTRPDLTPVFSFNAQGVYMPGGKSSSVDSIGRWRDLLRRMRDEGVRP